jgi:hypothetical protein
MLCPCQLAHAERATDVCAFVLQGVHTNNLDELQQADEEQVHAYELSDDDDEFASIMADAAAAPAGLDDSHSDVMESPADDSPDDDSDEAEAPAAVQPRRPKKPRVSMGRGAKSGRGKGGSVGKAGSGRKHRPRND